MGQNDVYDILSKLRTKSDKWYSIEEIKAIMEDRNMSDGCIRNTKNCLFKLSCANIIQAKGQGLWDHKKLFRAFSKESENQT